MKTYAVRQSGLARSLVRAVLLLSVVASVGAASAAGSGLFTIGTDAEEASITGKWMRRIYSEAFKRLDIRLEIATLPVKRLSAEVDAGAVDGEVLRVHAYASAHPNLVRVEEPVTSVQFALYTADPALRLNRLDDLPATGWRGEYRRGVAICEKMLKQWLPAERLSDVTNNDQGLKKLLTRRTEIYCENDAAVANELMSPEFRGVAAIRKLIDLGDPIPLYPYLHKKHADLAPRLAATLKQMKAEGLIERYRQEAERELGWAR